MRKGIPAAREPPHPITSGSMERFIMTKSELINNIAHRNPHLTQRDAEIIIDTIFDSMTDALANGDRIEIRGFGSFSTKHRAERQGRNPKTGEVVNIPAGRYPFFKVGKELSERINGIRSEKN